MSQKERDAYYNLNRIVNEESVADTTTFWYFIAGGAVGVILIGVLIYCLCKMKRRNDLIVAKVEKLEAGMHDNDPDKNDDFYNSRKKEKAPEPQAAPTMTSPKKAPAAGPAIGDDDPDAGPILTMKTADIGRTAMASPQEQEMIRKPFGEKPRGYDQQKKAAETLAMQATIDATAKADSTIPYDSSRDVRTNEPSDLNLKPQLTEKAQIEADKIAKMKELLKKGKADMPKRSVTNADISPKAA